jgi:hypothetical protein
VVSFPEGVIFRSARGIEFFDRGLSLNSPIPNTTYIGQPIQDEFGIVLITGGIHLPTQGQVRLYDTTGYTLVLDYVHWAWSVYSGQAAATGTVWNDRGAYWNAAVYAESVSVYIEGAALYSMQVATPWISIAGIGGLERVYRFQGIGLTAGDHTITVALCANGNGDDTVTTKSRAMLATEILWPWELRPRLQKMSSALLSITETSASPTAGPVITGIALVVGVKQGLRKLYAPAARLT